MNRKLEKSYSSFSGQDIRIIANGSYIGNITSISFNIQREKRGNYVIGEVDPVSFARGKRQISGIIKGLVLDTDFLGNKTFDKEVALLDKDQLFTRKKEKEIRIKRITRPKYPNLPPPPVKKTQIQYFLLLFNPTIPNFGQLPNIENILSTCIENIMEEILLGAAIAIVTGGLGTVVLAALLVSSIKSCIGGVVEESIFQTTLEDFALQVAESMYIFWSDDMYENYERNFLQVERNYLQKQSEVIIEEVQEEVESEDIIDSYAFLSKRNYNLENIGENYSVNPVEYLDQILPFDIAIIAVNEYGQSVEMRIYGVEALGESKSMSINNISLTYEIPFIARAILPWRSFDLKTNS